MQLLQIQIHVLWNTKSGAASKSRCYCAASMRQQGDSNEAPVDPHCTPFMRHSSKQLKPPKEARYELCLTCGGMVHNTLRVQTGILTLVCRVHL